MSIHRRTLITASVGTLVSLLAMPAFAYVGPGAGLGFIGTVFGLIAAILLAMVGLFWYPLKRLFGKKRTTADGSPDEPEDDDRR